MRIWEDKRAPNPRRVRIFLAEKKLDIPFVQLDIMAQEHQTDEHLGRNPLGRIPYLELDDGRIIAETMAICRYFDELHPEPVLFGKTAFEKATVEMWQRRLELNLLLPIAFVLRHGNARMAPLEQPQVPEWSEANRPKVADMLKLLDDHLAESSYIAGEDYSVADITALCAVDFMKVIKVFIGEDLPNLARWRQQVSQRPSAAA